MAYRFEEREVHADQSGSQGMVIGLKFILVEEDDCVILSPGVDIGAEQQSFGLFGHHQLHAGVSVQHLRTHTHHTPHVTYHMVISKLAQTE